MTLKERLHQQNIFLKDNRGLNPKYLCLLSKDPQLIEQIILATEFITKPFIDSTRERLYCILNNTIPPLCVCGNQITFTKTGKHRNTYHHTFCSLHCSNNASSVKEKKCLTTINNYGVSNPSKSDAIKQKKISTSHARFGSDYPWQANIRMDWLTDPKWLHTQHHILQLTLTEIGVLVNADVSVVSSYFEKYHIEKLHFTKSKGENEVNEFINDLGLSTVCSDRSLISPLELDIFIPSHNIAIEYCGVYWHSEQLGKDRHYHKKKHDLCKQQGIQLITLFEDEWLERNTPVKLKLKTLLGVNSQQRIFARKTNIIPVSHSQKKQFFDINHIQGNGPGSINIGLQHDSLLVACMSFIKKSNGFYYLNRYATSAHVIGGFTKLLTYFQQNHRWVEIVSFADQRWSTGNLYRRAGWLQDKIIPPDYSYSADGLHRVHKFNYRRSKLSKKLSIYDPKLSERENCHNNKLLRIWDCGKIRFKLTNNIV